MATNHIKTIIAHDFSIKAWEQTHHAIHNRWHPDIPPAASVKPDQIFRVECMEWTGGQIKNDDSADDIRDVDLSRCHNLSGPIAVEGAEPGDYLEVEILEIQPIPGFEWGYSGIFDVNNGGGFLCDVVPHAAKAIWDLEGIYTKSRHIPGLRFPGLMHPGIIGTAPSKQLLEDWNQRESTLVSSDPNQIPPLAHLPNDDGSLMGALEVTPEVARAKAMEAARTIPPREHGGNMDVKNLSKGAKVWFPVYIPGANLSVGDLHFSQGDGEISFCGAIEMHGAITMKVNLIKNGVELHGNLSMPMFMPGPLEPRFSKYLGFEGISVDENGKQQHYLDATLSFKNACLNVIRFFRRFGYSVEQIYLFLTCIPLEGRINAIVDAPNACCSLSVPIEIFEFDITPKKAVHAGIIQTNCPIATPMKTDSRDRG